MRWLTMKRSLIRLSKRAVYERETLALMLAEAIFSKQKCLILKPYSIAATGLVSMNYSRPLELEAWAEFGLLATQRRSPSV